MKKVYEIAWIDESRCIGDQVCRNVCPTGAIHMVDKKARVEESRCVACFKCQDVCNEGAIRSVPLAESRTLRVDPADVDQAALADVCRRANLNPEEPICLCTLTQAKEAAAAILKGASSPEEVTLMTGTRTSCAMWCMAPVLRLLQAHGRDMSPPPGYRWYSTETGVWNIPDEVARKYPEYRLNEDAQSFCQGTLDNLISKLK
jgi:Fe-S-cluster-containing hydrogenase component 2